MALWRRVVDHVGTRVPWYASAIAIMWVAPRLVFFVVGWNGYIPGERGIRRAELCCTLAMLGLAAVALLHRERPVAWRTLVRVSGWLGFVWVAGLVGDELSYSIAATWAPFWFPLVLLCWLLIRPAPRAPDAERDRGADVAGVAFIFTWLGVFLGAAWLFHYACFGPASPPEETACIAARRYALRSAGYAGASACLVWAWLRHREYLRRAGWQLPLTGCLLWTVTHVVVDGVSHVVGHAACTSSSQANLVWISELATQASVVAALGIASAMVCWVVASGGPSDAAQSTPARVVWTLAPTLWILTWPATNPPLQESSGQLAPPPIWEQVDGHVPLRPPLVGPADNELEDWSSHSSIAVLDGQGTVHVYHQGQLRPLASDAVLEAHLDPILHPGEPARAQLLLDARTTVGQLRAALHQLRTFDRVTVLWVTNLLWQASLDARSRWPFLELAKRSLRGRDITLLPSLPDGATPHPEPSAHLQRFRVPVDADRAVRIAENTYEPIADLLVMDDDDDRSMSAWLHATQGIAGNLTYLLPRDVAPDETLVRSEAASRGPETPLMTLHVPRESWGLVLGAILGLALQARRGRTPREALHHVLETLATIGNGLRRWALYAIVAGAIGVALPLVLS